MNFFKSKQAKSSSSNDHDHPFHHALINLQTHFTNFVRIANPFSSKLDNPCPTLKTSSFSHNGVEITPNISSVVDDDGCKRNLSLSKDEIKQRLNDVSVYRMSYSPEIILPVESDIQQRKALFYFLSESDAQAFLSETKTIEDYRDIGLQLIHVPLAEIIELEGAHCTRLVPDMSQVNNAVQEREKAGFHGENFSGVPVFQSDALEMMLNGTSNKLRPAFFRKEDLEKALVEEKQMNHTDIQGQIIQVEALEDIIQKMKDCSTSKWNDTVLVPPGNGKM